MRSGVDPAAVADRRMWITVGVYAGVAALLAWLADLPVGLSEQNWRSQAWMTAAYVVISALMTVYRIDGKNGLRRTNETLTEMLYVVALFWLTPWAFVGGRVFAAFAANHFTSMRLLWRVYNVVVYAIVSITLARVFLWIAPTSPLDGWRAPMVALSVWFLNDVIRIGLLSILDWVRFQRPRPEVLAGAFRTSYLRGVACAFGLLIAIALYVAPWSLTAVATVGVLFVTVSKANSRVANLDAGMNQVSQFSTAATKAQQPDEVERELMSSIEVFGRLDGVAIATAAAEPFADADAAGDDADNSAREFDWSGRHRAGLDDTVSSVAALYELSAGQAVVTVDGRGAVNVWLLDPIRHSFLVVETAEPNADHSDLWTIVGHLVDHARLAIDTVYKSKRLTDIAAREYERARVDPLTKLPNRLAANTEVAEWLKRADNPAFSLLLVESLDYQESVDVLGQEFGDASVVNFADYLRSLADRGHAHYLAHMGAARFLLLVQGDADRARSVAELACTGHASQVGSEAGGADDVATVDHGWPAEPFAQRTAIAGIATRSEQVGTVQELMRAAGIALDRATHDDQVASFGSTDAAKAERRISIRYQLGRAIDARHIVPEFQPQVSLASGVASGCEVLARWQHGDLGHVSPAEFIPVAEQTGQIDRLTLTVVEQALDAARYWSAVDVPFDLSINISARSLESPRFVRTLTRLIDEAGRPPSSTTIELTESILVDRASMIAALARIRELGFRISIDDFGTGYSALSYLDRLPADEVKIDRSMVRPISPDNPVSPVVNHLIELCQALGLSVCAEGIEDQYQLHVLRALGCDFGQGYLCSRSLTADAMTTWIATHRIAHANALDPHLTWTDLDVP